MQRDASLNVRQSAPLKACPLFPFSSFNQADPSLGPLARVPSDSEYICGLLAHPLAHLRPDRQAGRQPERGMMNDKLISGTEEAARSSLSISLQGALPISACLSARISLCLSPSPLSCAVCLSVCLPARQSVCLFALCLYCTVFASLSELCKCWVSLSCLPCSLQSYQLSSAPSLPYASNKIF